METAMGIYCSLYLLLYEKKAHEVKLDGAGLKPKQWSTVEIHVSGFWGSQGAEGSKEAWGQSERKNTVRLTT